MHALFLLPILFAADTESDARARARAALAMAAAQEAVKPVPVPVRPPEFPSYADASASAITQGKSLVVFVSCTPRPVSGTIVTVTATLTGVSGPAVVVARPYGQQRLEWVRTLSATASDSEIRIALGLEAGARPIPFESIPRKTTARPDGRDGDNPAVGR